MNCLSQLPASPGSFRSLVSFFWFDKYLEIFFRPRRRRSPIIWSPYFVVVVVGRSVGGSESRPNWDSSCISGRIATRLYISLRLACPAHLHTEYCVEEEEGPFHCIAFPIFFPLLFSSLLFPSLPFVTWSPLGFPISCRHISSLCLSFFFFFVFFFFCFFFFFLLSSVVENAAAAAKQVRRLS